MLTENAENFRKNNVKIVVFLTDRTSIKIKITFSFEKV